MELLSSWLPILDDQKVDLKPNTVSKPVADYLAKLLGKPVAFAEDCIGPKAEAAAKVLKPGEVLVLENTRFHAEEES